MRPRTTVVWPVVTHTVIWPHVTLSCLHVLLQADQSKEINLLTKEVEIGTDSAPGLRKRHSAPGAMRADEGSVRARSDATDGKLSRGQGAHVMHTADIQPTLEARGLTHTRNVKSCVRQVCTKSFAVHRYLTFFPLANRLLTLVQ